MTGAQIAFLVCGIVFILLMGVCIWRLIYRYKHPYDEYKMQQNGWLLRWIKSNITTILIILAVICLICAISFFTVIGTGVVE